MFCFKIVFILYCHKLEHVIYLGFTIHSGFKSNRSEVYNLVDHCGCNVLQLIWFGLTLFSSTTLLIVFLLLTALECSGVTERPWNRHHGLFTIQLVYKMLVTNLFGSPSWKLASTIYSDLGTAQPQLVRYYDQCDASKYSVPILACATS